ncbi:MAG: cytochrome P450 [Cellvibrionales bacterium]|nr:cytochrome P450 [Cellvibrionales bacterium]
MKTVSQLQKETAYKDQPDNADIKHIPGKYGIPILGRGVSVFLNFPKVINEHAQKWGDVSRIQIGDQKGVLLLGADYIQEVLLDKGQNWSAEMGYEKTMRNFYDGGVLSFDFDEHKMQRRILQTCFKNDAMRRYMIEVNQIMCEQLNQWDVTKPLEFYPEIKEILLRVGAKIFIGIDNNGADYQKLNKAFMSIATGFNDTFKKEIPGTPFYKGKRGAQYLREYFTSIIPERRNSDGTDMLTLMCKEKKEDGTLFSDIEISNHAAFILFGAHDTTTSVLNHLVYYSANDPDWQERLRAQSLKLQKTEVEFDDLSSLVDIENTFLECMRLHPPIPLLIRRSIKEVEFNGYRIPANTPVMIPAIHNHYSNKYWSSPSNFDPDRFSNERAEQKSHPFAYLPFGGGAHKCIGMHFGFMLGKAFMHQLLMKFDYGLPEDFEVKFQFVPLPKPAKLPLVLKKRC